MVIDCRTQEGIMVGLIDSLITITRIIRERGLTKHPAVLEALKDLSSDEDVKWILNEANKTTF